jgi:hypothetical protein
MKSKCDKGRQARQSFSRKEIADLKTVLHRIIQPGQKRAYWVRHDANVGEKLPLIADRLIDLIELHYPTDPHPPCEHCFGCLEPQQPYRYRDYHD